MKSKKEANQSTLNSARLTIAAISLVGFAIMIYLTYIHYESASRYFCDISGNISCSEVAQSAYSEILGVPISILGLGYFGFTFLLTLLNRKREVFKLIFLFSLFVLIPSLYFSWIEFFKIKVFCALCEASKVLMAASLAASFIAVRREAAKVLKKATLVIIAAGVATVITYFIQVSV